MTTIRANCPDCGDVQIPQAEELTVRICADDDAGSYNFRCPICGARVAKEASRRIVDLLLSSGCPLETWRLPAELAERPVGAPVTHDDLLSFHESFVDVAHVADFEALFANQGTSSRQSGDSR